MVISMDRGERASVRESASEKEKAREIFGTKFGRKEFGMQVSLGKDLSCQKDGESKECNWLLTGWMHGMHVGLSKDLSFQKAGESKEYK